MCIHRYKTLARFGLMHMVATNICVWLENIVMETVREVQKSTKRNTLEDSFSKNSEYTHSPLFEIILYSILCKVLYNKSW